jgi:hypothetical protein
MNIARLLFAESPCGSVGRLLLGDDVAPKRSGERLRFPAQSIGQLADFLFVGHAAEYLVDVSLVPVSLSARIHSCGHAQEQQQQRRQRRRRAAAASVAATMQQRKQQQQTMQPHK